MRRCENCKHFEFTLKDTKVSWGSCLWFNTNNVMIPMWSRVITDFGSLAPNSGISCKTWEAIEDTKLTPQKYTRDLDRKHIGIKGKRDANADY